LVVIPFTGSHGSQQVRSGNLSNSRSYASDD
jgi:hypothetical protein